MKALGFAAAFAALAVIACSDELKKQDVLAPSADATSTDALIPADQKSASVMAPSTVCASFHKELAATQAQLDENPASAELLDAKVTLEAMTADVCN